MSAIFLMSDSVGIGRDLRFVSNMLLFACSKNHETSVVSS